MGEATWSACDSSEAFLSSTLRNRGSILRVLWFVPLGNPLKGAFKNIYNRCCTFQKGLYEEAFSNLET